MTNTKQDNQTNETSTVDVDWDLQKAKITSSKHKAEFLVSKPRSALFFTISASIGRTPEELAGKFTSIPTAISAVQQFIRSAKETFAVKSDRLHEERQQRKNAESESKNG